MSHHRSPRRTAPQHAATRPSTHAIDTGEVALLPDRDGKGTWLVMINGVPSSYLNLDDPTRLLFEYAQWVGSVLDVMAAEDEPIDAVHIGGAGCTIPRYIAATRPGSRQIVYEIDAALVALIRSTFGLRRVEGLRIKVGDGRAGLATLPDNHSDVIFRDAFDEWAVPPHLTTVEYHREVSRVLRPGGIYLANIADSADVRDSRVEAAAATAVFSHVAMVAEPAQFRGRRLGNVVLLASQSPLPDDALIRRLASGAVRARYVDGPRVKELIAGVHPRRDDAT